MLGWTPLHFAARSKFPHLVQLLLLRGADPRVAANDGLTVLDYVEAHSRIPGQVLTYPSQRQRSHDSEVAAIRLV